VCCFEHFNNPSSKMEHRKSLVGSSPWKTTANLWCSKGCWRCLWLPCTLDRRFHFQRLQSAQRCQLGPGIQKNITISQPLPMWKRNGKEAVLTLRALRSISSSEQLTLGEPWAIVAQWDVQTHSRNKMLPPTEQAFWTVTLPESQGGEWMLQIWSTMNGKGRKISDALDDSH